MNWTIEKNFVVGTATVGSETITVNTFTGAKGDTGAQGIQGEQGIQGIQGETGVAAIQVTGLTLLSTGWTLDGALYKYSLANVNIVAGSIVDVIPDNDDVALVIAASIYPQTNSINGFVEIWAKRIPTADIGVTINIFN